MACFGVSLIVIGMLATVICAHYAQRAATTLRLWHAEWRDEMVKRRRERSRDRRMERL